MMKKTNPEMIGAVMILFLLISSAAIGGTPILAGPGNPGGKTVLMTYVGEREQVRLVEALLKSVRRFGGDYACCDIKVVRIGRLDLTGKGFRDPNVEILPLDLDRAILEYPLAVKAFAAALAEETVKDEADVLIWLDPGVLVLSALSELDLEGTYDAAMRPVTLFNDIGLLPAAALNEYWAPIYRETGLVDRVLPTFKTIVDEIDIQPYFNCEVYALNPHLGICREWAEITAKLLRDGNYQREACGEFKRRLFLHQAVLSGVIASRIKPERLKSLPLAGSYPFSQHEKLPFAKRLSALDQASVVIFDRTWIQDSRWMDRIPIEEPLKAGLEDIWREYLGR